MIKDQSMLNREIHNFVKEGFSPSFGQIRKNFRKEPLLERLQELGSELWLDTGSISQAQQLWTQEFTALTTNNTLLNREVQTGQYDSLIPQAAEMLSKYHQLSEQDILLEIGFILNAYHALRLVEQFDCYVSVEEHTDLANDVDRAVDYARRYNAICPERFIIKIPFTPAGLLATRRVSLEGIPVNHTLGFSARQNYLIARIGKPAYVNVFLGKLNSFVADNELGDGSFIGEKATLASQAAIKHLRERHQISTRQIGASFRSGKQVHDLAGIDIMTIPPKVAEEFLSMRLEPQKIADETGVNYKPGLHSYVDPASLMLNTLWDIDEKLVKCVDALEKEDIDSFTPKDLIGFFRKHDCSDLLIHWNDAQIAASTREGKIPQLHHWEEALENQSIGLDSVMNLAGLNSFATDQKAMDQRIKDVLAKNEINIGHRIQNTSGR
ncbi:MAG: transaldolase family protein [Sedimentisphaerales bacterium]|nr:transaldolase family protein [Sedimentisphaerales bacterium]